MPVRPALAVVLLAALVVAGCAGGPGASLPGAVAPVTARRGGPTSWERIGLSAEGRPIEAITLGHGPGRMLLIGGIHGDEPEGGRTINAVAAYLAALRPGATVRIVRDVNPDGTAAGTRANARGIDLNRNWPARNFAPGAGRGPAPLSEPETRALHLEMERFRPELVLVCHSSSRGPFVNFDGPGGPVARAFASGAAGSDPRWRVVAQMGYATPGSLGSYIGVDGGVPILTIEFSHDHDPERAWGAMRDGLDAVLHRWVPAGPPGVDPALRTRADSAGAPRAWAVGVSSRADAERRPLTRSRAPTH